MKYAWIKEHRDDYSVIRLCRAMQITVTVTELEVDFLAFGGPTRH